MNRYHLNPQTGDPGLCEATQQACPLGIAPAAHVNSESAVRASYERVMASRTLPLKATRTTARKVWRLPRDLDRLVYDVKIPAMHRYHASVTA